MAGGMASDPLLIPCRAVDEKALSAALEGIRKRATAEGVTLFPAVPDRANVSWPDEDWSAFIDAAVACGTKLLYLNTVTANEVLPEGDVELEGQNEELGEAIAAARCQGEKPCRLELAFSHGGLVHEWVEELPWLAVLDAFSGPRHLSGRDGDYELDGDHESFMEGWLEDRRENEEQQRAEFEKLTPEIERLASEIGEAHEYLSGRSSRERNAIALSLAPTLEEWRAVSVADARDPVAQARRRAARDVFGRAEERREQVMAQRTVEARADLDTLVGRLRQDPEYSQASNANIRSRRAKVLVSEWLGFPSPEIRDLLVARERQTGR